MKNNWYSCYVILNDREILNETKIAAYWGQNIGSYLITRDFLMAGQLIEARRVHRWLLIIWWYSIMLLFSEHLCRGNTCVKWIFCWWIGIWLGGMWVVEGVGVGVGVFSSIYDKASYRNIARDFSKVVVRSLDERMVLKFDSVFGQF